METFATHTGRVVALRRAGAVPDLLARWQADPGLVLGRPGYAGATILIASRDFAACPARGQAVTGQAVTGQAVTGQAVTGQAVTERAAGQRAAGQRAAGQRAAGQRAAGQRATAERAASALVSHRFVMMVSAGFDEIFCHSMTKSGVYLLCLPVSKISELQDIVDADPATLLTVDFGSHEMVAADKFSAVCEIVNGASGQLPGGRADDDEPARHGSKIAEPGR